MSRKEVESAVEKLLEPVLAENKIELVDVEYVRERNWVLRVFIDKDGGVDLNDCQEISEKAGAVLDEADVISDNYMLEVSSPGLDRVIKKDKDFIRYTGEEVDVKLFAPSEETKGAKVFTAILEGLNENGAVKLRLPDETSVELDKNKISQVRIHFSF